jgi:hypothetical protein
MSPSGAITSSSVSADGVRVTATGRLSGNSGGGSYMRADSCAGRWTANRNQPRSAANIGISGAEPEPELSPILSGFAAYYDPSLFRQSGS